MLEVLSVRCQAGCFVGRAGWTRNMLLAPFCVLGRGDCGQPKVLLIKNCLFSYILYTDPSSSSKVLSLKLVTC